MHRKKRRIFILMVVALLLLLCCGSVLVSSRSLITSSYVIRSEKLTEGIRLVQITDLHSSNFGEDNARLVECVKAQNPDLIVVTGDLNDSSTEEMEVAVSLLRQLCALCPVYVSLGNHELEAEEWYGIDVAALYEEAGATVLEYSFQDILVKGQTLRIGGLYGYCLPEKYLQTNEADPQECDFLSAFQDTEEYTILLTHMPACWMLNDGLDAWDIDCVFAGHVHGGEVIIPLLGGLYAPDYGWFPGKLQGAYYSQTGDKVLILSTGLGTTETIPRINNRPEVVCVDLLPAE